MKILAGVLVTAALGAVCGVGLGWLWRWGNELAGQGLVRFVGIALFTNLLAALAAYFVVRPGGDLSGTTGTRSAGVVAIALAVVAFLAMVYVASRQLQALGTPLPRVGTNLFTWGLALGFVQVFGDLRRGTWFGEESPRKRPSRAEPSRGRPHGANRGVVAETAARVSPALVPGEQAALPELGGETLATRKRPFLACYDYGMGGVWVLIDAHSPEQVSRTYPELEVVAERPDWMDDDQLRDIAGRMRFDIDEPPHGWLAELVKGRKSPL